MAGLGLAWQARRGATASGTMRHGRQGQVGLGEVWQARFGADGQGMARQVRPGVTRQGMGK